MEQVVESVVCLLGQHSGLCKDSGGLQQHWFEETGRGKGKWSIPTSPYATPGATSTADEGRQALYNSDDSSDVDDALKEFTARAQIACCAMFQLAQDGAEQGLGVNGWKVLLTCLCQLRELKLVNVNKIVSESDGDFLSARMRGQMNEGLYRASVAANVRAGGRVVRKGSRATSGGGVLSFLFGGAGGDDAGEAKRSEE